MSKSKNILKDSKAGFIREYACVTYFFGISASSLFGAIVSFCEMADYNTCYALQTTIAKRLGRKPWWVSKHLQTLLNAELVCKDGFGKEGQDLLKINTEKFYEIEERFLVKDTSIDVTEEFYELSDEDLPILTDQEAMSYGLKVGEYIQKPITPDWAK